ncbi:MAG: GNVR domain-containing protein [Desulfotomaculaceae bacterium]|nr:GNVR domain-containing protein [Desulfotomaculaceae bacterium]
MATNEPVNAPTPDDEEVHLLDYLLVLAKHSQMIIYTSIAVPMLTLLVLCCVPNQYTATARSLPPQQNMTMSAQLLDSLGGSTLPSVDSGGLGGMAASMLGLKSPGGIYVGMLTSNTILDRLVERFKLLELYGVKYIEDARNNLIASSEINAGQDGLISIAVTDKDPQQAAAIANAFVEELDNLLQQMASKEAMSRLAFLEKELTQASQKLTKAEEELRTFSEQRSVIQIEDQTKGMLEYIANLRATIDAKEVELQVLHQQATPFNYQVINLETELKSLKEKLRAAEAQTDQTCIGEVCIATSKVPALGLEYIRLYREVKFQEGLYQLYTRMVEIARVDMVRDVAVIQILDQAIPPEKKSKPKRLIIAMLGGIVTFFMMIVVALGCEYCRNLAQSESEAPRIEQLRVYVRQWRQTAQCLYSRLKRNKL